MKRTFAAAPFPLLVVTDTAAQAVPPPPLCTSPEAKGDIQGLIKQSDQQLLDFGSAAL